MDRQYKKFFELIEDVLKQQKAQKLRGLNDYNMVNVVRKATHEVGMHSNVIFSLINPDGLHYQNDLFLNLFIEIVLGFELKEFGKVIGVKAEEQTDKKRRIDFTIKSENYFIGIEMKVNAGDLTNQIAHYDEYLSVEADTQKVMMYYLTKDGKDAPLRSKGSVSIEKVSFQEHILEWLDACQNEVRNITNLNMALEDYKNIVKKITAKYKGNVVTIEDELLKSNKHLKSALLLDQKMNNIKGKTLNRFFKDIEKVLGKEFKNITEEVKKIEKDRAFDEKKCINLYSKGRNKPRYFGVFFNCNFSNDLHLSVELHIEYLYYGIVKLDNYNLIPLENEDTQLFKGISQEYRHIIKITNSLINDDILNFENSDLHKDILKLIETIKEKQT